MHRRTNQCCGYIFLVRLRIKKGLAYLGINTRPFILYGLKYNKRVSGEVYSFLLADLGQARGCSTNTVVTRCEVSDPFPQLTLRSHGAFNVRYRASNHKIYYITQG